MKTFWDKRYGEDSYAYGVKPNLFFRQELLKLEPKNLLLPAEGEGRNAVFAAETGWTVTAFDYSDKAKEKAIKLARNRHVEINYELTDFDNFKANSESFDCIALVYVHIPPNERKSTHKKMVKYLKPGGSLILESFSKDQIERNTGGPKNIDMLYSENELLSDFNELDIVKIETLEVELSEGEFHAGTASVIRLLARKKV